MRFEPKEVGVEIIGLTEAIRYANTIGMVNIETYNKIIAHRLRQNLSQIHNIQLLDRGAKRCNIITFYVKGKTLIEVDTHLKTNHIYFSQSLKSFALIDFTKKGVGWAICFSPHYFYQYFVNFSSRNLTVG